MIKSRFLREWRRALGNGQFAGIREGYASLKQSVRDTITPEQRRMERGKDARRKALHWVKEKKLQKFAKMMSIDRYLNTRGKFRLYVLL